MDSQTGQIPTGLLVVADREPLAWLLTSGRFAVPEKRRNSIPPVGSTLYVYTTRGCYRNPGRDRGLIMATASITHGARHLDRAVEFRGRKFSEGFGLEISGLCQYGQGVELKELAGHLNALPDAATWSAQMRRAVVRLGAEDGEVVKEKLDPLLRPPSREMIEEYVRACRVRL